MWCMCLICIVKCFDLQKHECDWQTLYAHVYICYKLSIDRSRENCVVLVTSNDLVVNLVF